MALATARPEDLAEASKPELVAVPDPHPMQPIPPNVLQEEDYTEAVSAIIERDFFPDLPHLRARYQLLQARLAGDEARAQALEWRLANLARPTPCPTPVSVSAGTQLQVGNGTQPALAATVSDAGAGAGGGAGTAVRLSAWEREDGTESTLAGSVDNSQLMMLKLISGREVTVDLNQVRLDDFQRVFTSEDNASFEVILAKDRERLRQLEWWIEDMECRHNTERREHAKCLENGGVVAPGILMTNVFRGRNSMSFHPPGMSQVLPEKPRVDFKNTRFTTAQQVAIEHSLPVAIAARKARVDGEKTTEVYEKMAREGAFDLSALSGRGPVRALGGRLQSPLPTTSHLEVNGYPLLSTPTLLPGVGGLSPLMTYGKVAATPRLLDECQPGPIFHMAEESERERAADTLQRGATQRQRASREQTRAERLRAFGIPSAPSSVRPAKSTPGGSSARLTPASVLSKVAPFSPIGQLIHRTQRLTQKGGRLHIGVGRSPAPSTPAPSSAPPRKRARLDEAAATAMASQVDSRIDTGGLL